VTVRRNQFTLVVLFITVTNRVRRFYGKSLSAYSHELHLNGGSIIPKYTQDFVPCSTVTTHALPYPLLRRSLTLIKHVDMHYCRHPSLFYKEKKADQHQVKGNNQQTNTLQSYHQSTSLDSYIMMILSS
jgi:hypothetical protein